MPHLPPPNGYQFSIVQRFPNCGTYPEPVHVNFNTKEELLNIPFIKSWLNHPDYKKLSISYRKSKQHVIMFETSNMWFAPIAFIKGSNFQDLNIPEFKKDQS